MKDPKVKQDPTDWEAGYAAGLAGKIGTAPADVDSWSWCSGFIEGHADRHKPETERQPHHRPCLA